MTALFGGRGLALSGRAAAVQVNQNVPRFGAFAGADDAAVFQLIHDAGGAAIAEAQTALQQRDAGLLFATNDFDALFDQLFVFVAPAFGVKSFAGFGELLVDFDFVTGLSLACDEIHDTENLLIGNEGALGANQFG